MSQLFYENLKYLGPEWKKYIIIIIKTREKRINLFFLKIKQVKKKKTRVLHINDLQKLDDQNSNNSKKMNLGNKDYHIRRSYYIVNINSKQK